nr:hypothetical protein [Anaerolineae bacterium]
MSENHFYRLLRSISTVRERASRAIMGRKNVVACGIGYKSTDNQPTGELSVVVSVKQKLPVDQLDREDIIPETVEDVPTDVVETGEIYALALDRYGRLRPVRPGVSAGHYRGSAGTIGCVVQRDGQPYLLSNNHVFALLNQALEGDPIYQPAPGDGGREADRIGVLAEYMPLQFMDISDQGDGGASPGGCAEQISTLMRFFRPSLPPAPLGPVLNCVDAALVLPDAGVDIDPRIVDVGGAPLGTIPPALGMKVIKSGRTTGLTQGLIMQVDVTVDVKYAGRTARFANQIMTAPLSRPGDSGSLVLDYERNAVGLLFSGSDLISVINPIQAVLDAFQIDLVTG